MINQDSDGLFDGDGEEPKELSWTETEWEKYLAEHETSVRDYLKNYDQLASAPDRIDEVARRLGWEFDAIDEPVEELDPDDIENGFDSEWEPYTLHRNPIFISTKALYLSLIANWERIAAQPGRVEPALGLTMLSTLYRGRENALQAVQALDLGDYSLAICFFKRALRELNDSLARLGADTEQKGDAKLLARFRDYALPRLFDLREIWLRVMSECREAQSGE
jgi:tetratricopeptide (TPR) repeat protein